MCLQPVKAQLDGLIAMHASYGCLEEMPLSQIMVHGITYHYLFDNNSFTWFPPLLGLMNDLWRFSVSDSTWTWMSGDDITNQPGIYGEKGFASSSNTPGSRAFAVGMQEFWLFGGDGYNGACIVLHYVAQYSVI